MSNATEHAFARITEYAVTETMELFESYGMQLSCREMLDGSQPNPLSADETSAVAVIGFAGVHTRGALTMVAPLSSVKAWHTGDKGTREELQDTIGEFSNMLLGRLKIRLLRHGQTILLSIPTTTSGRDLAVAPHAGWSRWLVFKGAGGPVAVRLDATFQDGFKFGPEQRGEEPLPAGEVLLF